jgi:hypothetical protein
VGVSVVVTLTALSIELVRHLFLDLPILGLENFLIDVLHPPIVGDGVGADRGYEYHIPIVVMEMDPSSPDAELGHTDGVSGSSEESTNIVEIIEAYLRYLDSRTDLFVLD